MRATVQAHWWGPRPAAARWKVAMANRQASTVAVAANANSIEPERSDPAFWVAPLARLRTASTTHVTGNGSLATRPAKPARNVDRVSTVPEGPGRPGLGGYPVNLLVEGRR